MTAVGVAALTEGNARSPGPELEGRVASTRRVGPLTIVCDGLYFSLSFLHLGRGARRAYTTMSNRWTLLAVDRNTKTKGEGT
jgi:hypothetical protein